MKKLVFLVCGIVLIALALAAVGRGQRSSKGSDVMVRLHMDGSWDMYIFEPCPGKIHVREQHDKDDPIHVVCER